jgi:Zn-dependent M28 family amino/carboxypeptidase
VYSERPAVVLPAGRGAGGTLYVTDAVVAGPEGTSPDTWPHPWATNPGPVVPQAVVAGEHYNRIVRLLARGVKVRLEVAIASRFYDDDPMSANVIGEIPGSDLADEVVMLGGCLDSWHAGTGATDNAAGAAVCMEAVRILQSQGLKPRRTVRIALWSGEEQGRLGSRAYVAEHFGSANEHKAEYEKLSCYFDVDYGAGRFRGIFLQGNEALRPIFRAWLAPFADVGASTVSLADSVEADHTSFDEVGIPGFLFIRDGDPFDGRSAHTNMDVYERIEPEALEQAAAILAAFVYHAATRDARLPRRP